jgi:hypothetical protein
MRVKCKVDFSEYSPVQRFTTGKVYTCKRETFEGLTLYFFVNDLGHSHPIRTKLFEKHFVKA